MVELDNMLKECSNMELIETFVKISKSITELRDMPFYTMRQFEKIQDDLTMSRLYLQLYYKEILTRELTTEEQNKVNEYFEP